MKAKCLVVLLAVVFVSLAGARPGLGQAEASILADDLELVFEVPVGDSGGEISVLPDPPGDCPEGPQAIAVDETGCLYIADSLGHRILVFDGQSTRTIDVPYVLYARDLAVSGNRVYILDSTDKVYTLDTCGELLATTELPRGMSSTNVLRIDPATDVQGELLLWCSDYVQFSLSTLPTEVNESSWGKQKAAHSGVTTKATAAGERGQDRAGARALCLTDQNLLELRDGNQVVLQQMRPVGGPIVSGRIIAMDSDGRTYVLVEELGAPNPGVQVELSLRVFNSAGLAIKALRLPLEDMAAVPWQPVAIDSAERVYVLVPGRTHVSVYRARFSPTYRSRLDHQVAASEPVSGAEADPQIMGDVFGVFKGYPVTFTRTQTRTRANQMITYSWTWHNTFDYTAGGTPRSSLGATKPSQLENLADGASVTRIPYCWGGWDTLWTYSDNWQWTSFGNALTKYYPSYGPLVGNRNCIGNLISGTCGVDCAGFVSAASDTYYIGVVGGNNCKKPGCSNLMADGKPVSDVVSPPSPPASPNYVYYSALQPMDFFVASNHVLYYNHRLRDGSGIATLEATTGGSPQAAKAYFRTWSDINSYVHRSWWDLLAGEDFNKALTSKTGLTGIQGRQIYYKFQASSSSTTITLTASYGDPDLYVYNSSYGYLAKSTNTGSDSLTISTTPGAWYYIKVHAFLDSIWTINW